MHLRLRPRCEPDPGRQHRRRTFHVTPGGISGDKPQHSAPKPRVQCAVSSTAVYLIFQTPPAIWQARCLEVFIRRLSAYCLHPLREGDAMSQHGANPTVGGRRAHSGVDARQRKRRPD